MPESHPSPAWPSGMLFFFAGVLATGCLAIGAVWVWLEPRQSAA
jgi:hypothetical protein